MRPFNYSKIKEEKWDSEILGLIAAIYKFAGKQELYLKQRPDELEKLVEIAKIQSTEASNAIEGIVTTNTRIKQLVEEKTTPKNREVQITFLSFFTLYVQLFLCNIYIFHFIIQFTIDLYFMLLYNVLYSKQA